MVKAHINIGSNLGDSHALLERVVAGVVFTEGIGNVRKSDVIMSEPWGFGSRNMFLNIGVELETAMSAGELFRCMMELQSAISDAPHRTPEGGYADRLVDIDLIFYGDMVVDSAELTLPHPRMHLREFVLKPVVQLSPDWKHPLVGKTAAELLDDLRQGRAISAESMRWPKRQ